MGNEDFLYRSLISSVHYLRLRGGRASQGVDDSTNAGSGRSPPIPWCILDEHLSIPEDKIVIAAFLRFLHDPYYDLLLRHTLCKPFLEHVVLVELQVLQLLSH